MALVNDWCHFLWFTVSVTKENIVVEGFINRRLKGNFYSSDKLTKANFRLGINVSMCHWGNLKPVLQHTVEVLDVVFFQRLTLVSGQRESDLLSCSSGPKPWKTAELPAAHSPSHNVDHINPAAEAPPPAAMFSLDNQMSLQVLKTDTRFFPSSDMNDVLCSMTSVAVCYSLVITCRCAGPKKTNNSLLI